MDISLLHIIGPDTNPLGQNEALRLDFSQNKVVLTTVVRRLNESIY